MALRYDPDELQLPDDSPAFQDQADIDAYAAHQAALKQNADALARDEEAVPF